MTQAKMAVGGRGRIAQWTDERSRLLILWLYRRLIRRALVPDPNRPHRFQTERPCLRRAAVVRTFPFLPADPPIAHHS